MTGGLPELVTETNRLLKVVEEPCPTRSSIVAVQLAVEGWYATMPEPTVRGHETDSRV